MLGIFGSILGHCHPVLLLALVDGERLRMKPPESMWDFWVRPRACRRRREKRLS